MAIRPKSEREDKKQVIDLSGPQGNAFYLIATASNLAKKIGLDSEEIINEMQSGDYENLIETFDEYFGMIIDLQR